MALLRVLVIPVVLIGAQLASCPTNRSGPFRCLLPVNLTQTRHGSQPGSGPARRHGVTSFG
jgi:hypothetical protein